MNALALIGDYYHSFDYIKNALENLKKDLDINIHYKANRSNIHWDELRLYDIFIIAKSGVVNPTDPKEKWMRAAHESYIVDFVKYGGGLLILHSGLADYQDNRDFRKLTKGHFLYHPNNHQNIQITSASTKYGITDGVDDFYITDEQYFVDVDKKETDIILYGNSQEYGTSIAGWAHKYGSGKVVCLTPGHTEEVLTHPMMKKILINSIKWLKNS